MTEPLLRIEDLRVYFKTDDDRPVRAIDSLSLRIDAGEVVGLVGESGCGKSVTALSIIRLLPDSADMTGVIHLEGTGNLLTLGNGEMTRVRGNALSIIFQEPMTALNPVQKAGRQIDEVFRLHRKMGGRDAKRETLEMLHLAGIGDPEIAYHSFPHQLSGGMRQRILLAMALACRPKLLIADEPTTALDVTIQAQILDLMKGLQAKLGMALLLISHDLAVVGKMADRVAVMYAGEIVEEGAADSVLFNPRHPYTRALLRALPRMGGDKGEWQPIAGNLPDPREREAGCRFRPRCPSALDRCAREHPRMLTLPGEIRCRCVPEVTGGREP